MFVKWSPLALQVYLFSVHFKRKTVISSFLPPQLAKCPYLGLFLASGSCIRCLFWIFTFNWFVKCSLWCITIKHNCIYELKIWKRHLLCHALCLWKYLHCTNNLDARVNFFLSYDFTYLSLHYSYFMNYITSFNFQLSYYASQQFTCTITKICIAYVI